MALQPPRVEGQLGYAREHFFHSFDPAVPRPRNVSHVNTHWERTEISTLTYCSAAQKSNKWASAHLWGISYVNCGKNRLWNAV